MNLIDTFKISKKDIITIVGAGGKTSLMYSASSLLRKDYKVLVTTTTHIYIPDKSIYDEIIMLNDFPNENYHSILQNNKNGVYVIGNHTVNNSKIKAALLFVTVQSCLKIDSKNVALLLSGVRFSKLINSLIIES